MPWVCFRNLPVTHRPHEVDRWNQHSKSKYRRTGRRQHIEHLKLGRICVIPARHSHKSGDKLWQERQVKPDKDDQRAKTSPAFRIHSTSDLGPPVVKPTEIPHQCTTHHDVMKVRYHEVGIT